MQTYLLDMLLCPVCYGDLDWQISEWRKERVETAVAHCQDCTAVYPVQDGIGIFLTPDLPRKDLWDQVASGLIQHLQQHPELTKRILLLPVTELVPADQFLRTLLLEEQGDYTTAQKVEAIALKGLYTPAYRSCWQRQLDAVIDQLSGTQEPIIDLASGRGYLIKKILTELDNPVVATDFSPGILRRNRQWLESCNLYDKVSLLAFDARRTPFKDNVVQWLTSNLGLPNIEEPNNLLRELKRITNGNFLAVMHFFPENDTKNGQVIKEAGLESFLYRGSTLDHFANVGWQIEMQNTCQSIAQPTPPSAVLEGLRIDGLPIAETTLEWCLLNLKSENQ